MTSFKIINNAIYLNDTCCLLPNLANTETKSRKGRINKVEHLIIGNSYRKLPDFSSASTIKNWHICIGREPLQVLQLYSLAKVLRNARVDSLESNSVFILLQNYGRTRRDNKTFYNCFKQEETDIFIHNGIAWHSYTKYQIDTFNNLLNLFKTNYNILSINKLNDKTFSNENPTPQLKLE